MSEATGLDEGEAESLALAHCRQLVAALDDKQARAVAEAVGVRYLGSAGVLLRAFAAGRLSYSRLQDSLRDISGALWLSPGVVAEILKTARQLKR